MLIITQLLFQQNSLVLLLKAQNITICTFVSVFLGAKNTKAKVQIVIFCAFNNKTSAFCWNNNCVITELVGIVFRCFRRVPKDGTPVPKRVAV
jgi:hypothetical protein